MVGILLVQKSLVPVRILLDTDIEIVLIQVFLPEPLYSVCI